MQQLDAKDRAGLLDGPRPWMEYAAERRLRSAKAHFKLPAETHIVWDDEDVYDHWMGDYGYVDPEHPLVIHMPGEGRDRRLLFCDEPFHPPLCDEGTIEKRVAILAAHVMQALRDGPEALLDELVARGEWEEACLFTDRGQPLPEEPDSPYYREAELLATEYLDIVDPTNYSADVTVEFND
jgi:hypothetical protein